MRTELFGGPYYLPTLEENRRNSFLVFRKFVKNNEYDTHVLNVVRTLNII